MHSLARLASAAHRRPTGGVVGRGSGPVRSQDRQKSAPDGNLAAGRPARSNPPSPKNAVSSKKAPHDGTSPALSAAVDLVATLAASDADSTTDAHYAAFIDGAVLTALSDASSAAVAAATAALARETRKAFSADASTLRARLNKVAEPHRVAVRVARRGSIAALEAAARRSELGLDAARRGEREVDAVAAAAVKEIDDAMAATAARLIVK